VSGERDRQEMRRLQHEGDRVKPRSKVSVLGYITILFAAAFMLLLLSYLMQQRKNEEVISGLKESVSAMQSIENLLAENDALSGQVEALEEELERKTAELDGAEHSADKLVLQVYALDWLREIQSLYAKRYYKAARAMIAEFEDAGLAEHLPDYPLHTYDGSDVPSPLEAYTVIVEALT